MSFACAVPANHSGSRLRVSLDQRLPAPGFRKGLTVIAHQVGAKHADVIGNDVVRRDAKWSALEKLVQF